ncbi:coagulation factor 5/8 type domain-containing protein [Kockovaella imperatae]|uniref:Coagulation factor 5/8 type domain-containing protein n=1 Tax=Kockovaella imperatae TaxID=4999 RepID=A0A1Y1UJD9_9TREE|nr:coagulation factor 5/8 type domain-containing protein [Kockovaella imperatae]ORX38168.1 coagulation factor 5/8 type domain-containing protein [Kockovaella imperatae]
MFSLLALPLLAVAAAVPVSRQDSGGVKELWLFNDIRVSDANAIKTAGYDTVIMFQLGIFANASLAYYGDEKGQNDNPVLLVDGGVYVEDIGLADIVTGYKTGTTTIDRTEITIVSGNVFWQRIQAMVEANGTGPDTALYQNFAALKTAWNLDAINDDDEENYDVSSTVAFAQMLGQIGYKFTTAPYTNTFFWAQVGQGINDANLYDRSYLQCYDGGEGNDPGLWAFEVGMPQVPLLWVTNTDKPQDGNTPAQVQSQMQQWKDTYGSNIAGGGLWNDYDIYYNNNSYQTYAQALEAVFG